MRRGPEHWSFLGGFGPGATYTRDKPNFGDLRTCGVQKIYLLSTSMNKGKWEAGAL